MSDQDPDDERHKGLPLSSLVTKKSEAEPSVADDLMHHRIKPLAEGGGVYAAQQAEKLARRHDLSAIELHILSQPNAAVARALGEGSISERLRNLIDSSDASSPLLAASLAASQTTLDQLREFREEGYRNRLQENLFPPKIRIPENPLIETNKRLERIENLFEKVSHVAESSAQTAVALQFAAAEFLNEFKEAASKNDEAASEAIKLGKLAMYAAVGMPVVMFIVQIAANYVTPNPVAEALQQTVSGLQAEIKILQATEAAQTQLLIEAIATSDEATAAAILEGLKELQAPIAGESPTDEKR